MLKKIWLLLALLQAPFAYGEENKMSEYLDIDIVWGGYYAGIPKDGGEISVFRLLDFNRDAYHISIFKGKFQSTPNANKIQSLRPYIGHAPIDSKGLLNYQAVVLIAAEELSNDDLVGYMYYLKEFDVSAEERENLSQSLISFSNEPPLALRLSIEGGELQISERK